MSKDKEHGLSFLIHLLFPEHLLAKCLKISSLPSPYACQSVGIAPYHKRNTYGSVAEGLAKHLLDWEEQCVLLSLWACSLTCCSCPCLVLLLL